MVKHQEAVLIWSERWMIPHQMACTVDQLQLMLLYGMMSMSVPV